ncbi:terminase small subunit [Aquicoccus sp. SU-CL01552]|uniref:terminase small subunit n=1 Tax=Aquicoccus sp. SU-CL01552 TaxID=3127656 RepID=UPI003105067B
MKNENSPSVNPPWRPRKIKEPSQLLDQFIKYAKHVEKSPLVEKKILNTSSGPVIVKLRRCRPMTITNFCLFLGISSQAWRYWRKNREDLAETMEYIENVVFAYKFERVAAGILKANIISRELGLQKNT